MSDAKNVGRRRAAPSIPGIVGKAASKAKGLAAKAAKKAEGIHGELSERLPPPASDATRSRPQAGPAKAPGDAALAAELEKKRLAGHLRGAKSASSGAKSAEGTMAKASSTGVGDVAGAIGDAVADGLEALRPDRDRSSVRWVSGPWLKIETVADEETPEAHRNRIGDASQRGKTLIGIEAGLLRFVDVDLEAAGKLGRVYVSGAIDFVKLRARIFADGDLKGVDLGLKEGFTFDRPAVGGMIGAESLAELVGAHYEVGYDTPTVTMLGREVGVQLTARLDAAVHAYARTWLEVSVGMRNAGYVGMEAFAGASATLSGQAELAPFADVHGSVSAWAGTGFELAIGGELDLETGDVKFENRGGFSPIVGVGYDWGVSVNVFELAKFVLDHQRLEPNALPELQETGDDISRIIGDFVDAMSGSGEIGGRVLGLGLEIGADAVAAGADVVGAAISSGGNPGAVDAALKDAAGDVARSVGDAAATVFGWFTE